jgi:hypothetical protein
LECRAVIDQQDENIVPAKPPTALRKDELPAAITDGMLTEELNPESMSIPGFGIQKIRIFGFPENPNSRLGRIPREMPPKTA